MTCVEELLDDSRMQAAIDEMKGRISERYPDATFSVGLDDNLNGVELTATVDLDDTDEVFDLIVDRLVDIQVEEGLPLYVVPLRTPERVAAWVEETRDRWPIRELSILDLD